MAVRFRIGQASRPLGQPDTSRHDLVIDEEIQLVVVEPAPAAGITYQWEIIDRAYTEAELTSTEGATTTIGPSSSRPFEFEVELRAYKNGVQQGSSRRVFGARSPIHNLRLAMFGETADAASRLSDPRPAGSTDNAIYPSLAGGPAGQNWRGWAQFLNELVMALEHAAGGGGGGSGDAVSLRGQPVAGSAPANNDVLTFGNGGWAPRPIPAPAAPSIGGDLSGTLANARVVRLRGEPVADVEPEEGQLLGYQGGAWNPTTPSLTLPDAGGDASGPIIALSIDKIKGLVVASGAPTVGQVLAWVGGHTPAWTAQTLTADGDVEGALAELVVSGLRGRPLLEATPAAGQLLGWADTPTPGWRPVNPPEVPDALEADAVSLQGRPVSEDAPSLLDVLTFDGAVWAPSRPPIAGFAIQDGQTPTSGQTLILQDDGINPPTWRFGPADTMDADSLRGHEIEDELPLADSYLYFDGTKWKAEYLKLAGFAIADTGPTDGQILVFRETQNGDAWHLEDLPTGDASSLRGKPVSATAPNASDQLVFNGTSWVPSAPPVATRSTDGYLLHGAYGAFADKYGPDSAALPVSTDVLHLYVATTGNDVHDGTIAQPLRTMTGVYARMPLVLDIVIIVHFASGTYDYVPPPPHFAGDAHHGCLIFVGDGAGQASDDGFTQVAAGTTTSGSTDELLNISGSPAVDAYAYCTLLITVSGFQLRRLVSRNTATTLTPSAPVYAAPLAGTAFRIVRPAVIFKLPNSSPWRDQYGATAISGAAKQVHFAQVSFDNGRAKIPPDAYVTLLGVEFRPSTTLLHLGAQLVAGANAGTRMGRSWDVPALLGGSWDWEGWGLTSTMPNDNFFDCLSDFHGYFSVAGWIMCATSGDSVKASAWRGGRCGALTTRIMHHFSCYNSRCHIICAANQVACDVGSVFVGNSLHVEQNGPNAGIVIQRSGSMHFGWIEAACSVSTYTALRVMGRFVLENNPCTFSSVNAPAIHVDGGILETNYFLTATASAPGNCAVLVEAGGQIRGATGLGTLQVTNTGTGANTDGVRVKGGAMVTCFYQAQISSSGSTGYGVNCRGGGRFIVPGQPTQIVGPTTDFTVGVNSGDDFNDTDLAVPFATRVSGISAVGRSA